ncbi:MAG: hypothetical protein ACTIMQ_06125, partial [Acinetobacter guillouiae]
SIVTKAFEFGKFLKICGFLAFDYKEGDWFKKRHNGEIRDRNKMIYTGVLYIFKCCHIMWHFLKNCNY